MCEVVLKPLILLTGLQLPAWGEGREERGERGGRGRGEREERDRGQRSREERKRRTLKIRDKSESQHSYTNVHVHGTMCS